MQIKIIAVGEPTSATSKNGKSYDKVEVTYKSDGKTQTKQLISFSNKDTYLAMLKAKAGETYEVTTEKDGNGYWQWLAVARIEGNSATTEGSASQAGTRSNNGSTSRSGNWETPEERAARQVMITKQNAMGVAATFLASKAKSTEADLFRLGASIFTYYQGIALDVLGQDTLEREFEGEEAEVV